MIFLCESFLKAFEIEELPNFVVFSQNSYLDQEQLNEIEKKAQAKKHKESY